MAATTAPTPKAAAYSRAQPVKRSKAPPTMPIATSSAPPLSSAARGKRPRASEGIADTDKDRPRRVKSSRGQKRADVTGAIVDAEPKAENGSNGTATAQGAEGGGAYRRVMFASFIKQAFEKRAKGDNEEYNQIIVQFRALLPSATASAAASTSSGQATATPLSQLRSWLEALTSVVSKLDQSHAPLVETILSIPWAITEEAFTTAYMRFVGALVSARTEWLKVVLERCVKGFKYRSTYTQSSPHALPHLTRRLVYSRLHSLLRLLLSLVPTLSSSLSPLLALHFPSKRESRAAQICYIDNLLHLTEYCSALSEDVLTLVVERALNIDVEIQGEPEDWEEVEEEMLAAEAAKASDGKAHAPETAVHDLVDRPMDEESDDSDSDDDDDDDDGEDGGLDLDNLSSDDDEPDPINDDDAQKKAAAGQRGMTEAAIRKVLDNRAKLDGILKVVLDHLAVAHSDPSHLDKRDRTAQPTAANPFDTAFADPVVVKEESGSRETTPTAGDVPNIDTVERRMTLFRTFLDIFDRTLLRTFKTRNVQFVLFYLCSLDTSSSDHFIGVLLGRALFDSDAPSVTRVAAAGYVASFIARAKYVDATMTRKVVRHLCGYLEGQMEDFARATALATSIAGSRSIAASGGQELPVFYAVAQAVFYIFCFRWKDLLEEEDADDETALFGLDAGRRWMMGLETVRKAVNSSFNPLKVCAQPVVTQFASIAHKTSFMYCYSILDSNRRSGSYRDANTNAAATQAAVPPPPLRTVSTSSLLNTLTAAQLHLSTPSPAGTPAPQIAPAAAPRQLLVAEEMDSFFPFDPFKLPLSSAYIDPIYREWEGADDDESTTSGDHSSSVDSEEDETDSESDATAGESDADEPAWVKTRGGLAVPGSVTSPASTEDEEFSRSFEAMSLSLSPHSESFGGRRRK